MSATRLVTADELERFPSDDNRYELVHGRLVPMTPVSFSHGRTVVALAVVLGQHVRTHRLGAVLTEVGFTLASNPDTVRAPDLAFIRRDRIPSPEPQGFWKGAPDLAVEVLSPDDRAFEVQTKIHEYLAHGVSVVAVVDPREQTVTIYRAAVGPVVLDVEGMLDLCDVVEGFRCAVREIFT